MRAAVLYLGVPVALALGLLVAWFGIGRSTRASFFNAEHRLGGLAGATTLAVCWTWVFALMVGPQKAYQGGMGPLAWFVVCNTAALLLMGLLALYLLRKLGGRWESFTGFIHERYGSGMLGVYTVGITGMMTYAVWSCFTGSFVLFEHVTHARAGILVPAMSGGMLLLALARGIESSLSADMVKALIITAMLVVVIVVIGQSGTAMLAAGSRGVTGNGPGVFSRSLLVGFGFPVGLSLFSATVIDQQLWQRAFSLKRSPKTARIALTLAAPIFGLIVLGIGSLGFVAAGLNLKPGQPELAGFEAVAYVLPGWSSLFMLMIAAALLATGVSALNAASSAWALDVLTLVKAQASERTLLRVARSIMVLIVISGAGLARAGITLEQMILFIGTFRGALIVPTLFALFVRGPQASGLFTGGILLCMLAGPVVALETSPFAAGLGVLAVSSVLCVIEHVRARVTTPVRV